MMPRWRTFYHLVWGTRGREPLIDPKVEHVLRGSFRTTLESAESLIHGMGFMPDHVHLALSIPPAIAVSNVVKTLKGASSHLVNRADVLPAGELFGWQREFGVFTFSERSLPDVVSYVEDQKNRHRIGRLIPDYEHLGPIILKPPESSMTASDGSPERTSSG
jgi:putative transposase